MDINDENLSDFPDISRGAHKLMFLRLGSGINFLQVFKSLSLASTNMILMLCGTEIGGLTVMSEYQKCIQEQLLVFLNLNTTECIHVFTQNTTDSYEHPV